MEITEKLKNWLSAMNETKSIKIIESGIVELKFIDVVMTEYTDWSIEHATIKVSKKYLTDIKNGKLTYEKNIIEKGLNEITTENEIQINDIKWKVYVPNNKIKKGSLSNINIKKWGAIVLVVLAIGDQLAGISGFSIKDFLSKENKENDVKESVIFDKSEIGNATTFNGGNVENFTINNYPKDVTDKSESDKINSNVNQSRINDKRDGNHYSTIKLGGNIWLTENLKYILPNGNSYCYEDNPINCDIYGRLYQWNDVKKACPKGWRLPTIAEWRQLGNSFGGLNEGDNLPENVRKSYDVLKKGGQSGFDLLASGVRLIYKNAPSYYGVIEEGYYWSSDTRESDNIQVFLINANDGEIEINVEPENRWLPCRCIKK